MVRRALAIALAALGASAHEHATAGLGNEVYFLRSADDNFILVPSGRFIGTSTATALIARTIMGGNWSRESQRFASGIRS